MTQRPRLLLLIPHLGGGGAERVMALVAAGISSHRYEVHLGIVVRSEPPEQADFPGVHLHMLSASRVRTSALALLHLVWLIRPHLILSGMFHLNFVVLGLRFLFPRRTRVLLRQNGTVSTSLAGGNQPRYNGLLYKLLYPRADAVICQTAAMADDLAATIGLSRDKLIVLANPIDTEAPRQAAGKGNAPWSGPGPHLLAVGRLSREKGFDLLLGALHSLRALHPDADLVIAGSGSEEASLKVQCAQLDLQAAVRFAGYSDPANWFAGATLFVLSSRDEGMPNAMLEAAAAGLPLVALPASGGVTDLLRACPGVWLAAEISAAALAETLQQALNALHPQQRFAHAFLAPFEKLRAIQAYEDAFDATLEPRRHPAAVRLAKTQGPFH
jgi:glycosyltransferase involved in cell wall biosynthesis